MACRIGAGERMVQSGERSLRQRTNCAQWARRWQIDGAIAGVAEV